MKELLVIGTNLSHEPEIGRWLWALQDTRVRLMRVLESLTPTAIDWIPPGGQNSIGTVLYHIADIEADWLYVEVLEQAIPAEVMAIFPYPTRDAQGKLTHVQGFSLDQHLSRLEIVRALLLETFQKMSMAEFRRVRSLTSYDVTPEWVLHHLIQHESEHRGQIGTLLASMMQ